MDIAVCNACGKCCKKHWILKLTNQKEIELFGDDVVFGNYIWTDSCKYMGANGLCSIHDERQPYKCKEYFCEGNII